MTRRFVLDVESTSTVDLKKAGPAAYWEHPGTVLICVCYRVDDGPIHRWVPGDPIPYFVPELFAGGWRVVAHNWLFEWYAWTHRLQCLAWPRPHAWAWDCTMARALYWGLPAKLEHVAEAMALPVTIDPEKNKRILRTARPRSIDKATGVPVWWHETDPEKREQLLVDCETDVHVESLLDAVLPPLPARERKIFEIDGRINQRGIKVDLALVDRLSQIIDAESGRLNERMDWLTWGKAKTTNQVKVIGWCVKELGVDVPDLAKDTVAAVLSRPDRLHPVARDILLTRQEAAKSSTGKLAAMRAGASAWDGRCRCLFQYGGAGRTLRWAGRRVQPQNYPRGTVKNLHNVYPLVLDGIDVADLDMLLPGTVMDAVASMLRGCLVAEAGHVLVSGDLSQIEARVIAWLAGQQDILDVFARGDDVYRYTADKIGSDSRQLGKVLCLACSFGMGPERFQETALTYGVELELWQAELAVSAWRGLNHNIVSFWYDVDRVVKRIAVSPHGTVERLGKLIFTKTRKAMRITLPSTREMTYQLIEVESDGDGGWDVSYMGVHPTSKKWERIRTYGARICLAGDTLVLTDRGWLPIVDVRLDDRVWDGDAWVPHGGVVCNGRAEIIAVDGVGMTPDHEVLTTEGWRFGAHTNGLDRAPVALPDGCPPRWDGTETSGGGAVGSALRLWKHAGYDVRGLCSRGPKELRVPTRKADRSSENDARDGRASGLRGLVGDARSVPEPEKPRVEKLRRQGDYSLSRMGRVSPVLGGHGADVSARADPGAKGQRSRIFGGKLHVGNVCRADREPAPQVYDVVNAGPRHRFVVAGRAGPLIVHNCENVTQALARDVLTESMIALEADGEQIVGTVHDELLLETAEAKGPALLAKTLKTLGQTPVWAPGLPVSAEGWFGPRYKK